LLLLSFFIHLEITSKNIAPNFPRSSEPHYMITAKVKGKKVVPVLLLSTMLLRLIGGVEL